VRLVFSALWGLKELYLAFWDLSWRVKERFGRITGILGAELAGTCGCCREEGKITGTLGFELAGVYMWAFGGR